VLVFTNCFKRAGSRRWSSNKSIYRAVVTGTTQDIGCLTWLLKKRFEVDRPPGVHHLRSFFTHKQAEKEMEVTIARYLGSSEKMTIRSQ
jgi:hypothetical protein